MSDELRSYAVSEEKMEGTSVHGEIGVEITQTDEGSVKVAAEAAGFEWKETKEGIERELQVFADMEVATPVQQTEAPEKEK